MVVVVVVVVVVAATAGVVAVTAAVVTAAAVVVAGSLSAWLTGSPSPPWGGTHPHSEGGNGPWFESKRT